MRMVPLLKHAAMGRRRSGANFRVRFAHRRVGIAVAVATAWQ
jgi:hypothetical protein